VLAWSHPAWDALARYAHIGFGILMIVSAAASTRPWIESAPFGAAEDQIHSFAATAMGFAFALGVFAVMVGSRRTGLRIRPLDGIAILASVVIPLSMAALPGYAGILQRLMFLVAYLWYAMSTRRAALQKVPMALA
jgi:hypothetical protein